VAENMENEKHREFKGRQKKKERNKDSNKKEIRI
jgi:hypothetical protein